MPRQSVLSQSSKKRKTWDPDQMKKAIEAVRTKVMGNKKAEKTLSVPKSTLKRLVKDSEESLELLVHKTHTATSHGKKLVEYILWNKLMEYIYYGLTRMDVKKWHINGNNKNKFRKEVVGGDWLEHLLKRHEVNSDTNESSDTSCISCGMSYSSDRHGEEWIQCPSNGLIQPVLDLKANITFVIFVVNL
ncbi:hypothetical protein WA026_017069 [Henosepilachna vigintioctopunctata]|uniref:HTH psq-type domain-containing protein n=1 Tax=Henosepilachna vigintioctopunctata TaxID=420089 RepID=A0AAW1TV41_9CUCU